MATGAANLMAFECALDMRDIKYTELDSQTPGVRIRYNMDNLDTLDVFFWFDEDGETLHFGTGVIAHVPKDRTDVALRAINDANSRYRWITFYLDKDHDIVSSGDQVLIPNVVGDTCQQLLSRTLSICDEAYTSFMRALWAQ